MLGKIADQPLLADAQFAGVAIEGDAGGVDGGEVAAHGVEQLNMAVVKNRDVHVASKVGRATPEAKRVRCGTDRSLSFPPQ